MTDKFDFTLHRVRQMLHMGTMTKGHAPKPTLKHVHTRDSETDRDRQGHRDRDRDTETETERQRQKERETERERERDRKADRDRFEKASSDVYLQDILPRRITV